MANANFTVARRRGNPLPERPLADVLSFGEVADSREAFQRWFSRNMGTAVGMVEHTAFESKSGFSLDDQSRAAILAKVDELRRTIAQATVKFAPSRMVREREEPGHE